MKLTILLLLISLSRNAVADQTRILSGETATYNGILIDDDWYKELVLKRRGYDDMEEKLKTLSALTQQKDQAVCETKFIDSVWGKLTWFFVGGAVGVLAIEIAK